jgi:hypothetical protein
MVTTLKSSTLKQIIKNMAKMSDTQKQNRGKDPKFQLIVKRL